MSTVTSYQSDLRLVSAKKQKLVLLFLVLNSFSVSLHASDVVLPEVSPWEYLLCQPSSYASSFARECTLWTEGTWADPSRGCLNEKNPMPWSSIEMVIAKAQLWDKPISASISWSEKGVALPYNGCWSNPPLYSPIGDIEIYNVSPFGGLTVRRDRTVTCPAGSQQVGSICQSSGPNPYRNNGTCHSVIIGDNPTDNGTNPINAATGDKLQQDRDIPPTNIGTLGFKRYYSSSNYWMPETLGSNWRHTYSIKIQESVENDVATVTLFRANGDRYSYHLDSAMEWKAVDPDIDGLLRQLKDTDGVGTGWVLVNINDVTETYDAQGRLTTLTAIKGNTESLTYDLKNRLQAVTDNLGRALNFTYYDIADATTNKIQTITDYANRIYTYNYSGEVLTSVNYPDSTSKTYLYEDSRYPAALTGIIDQNSTRYATWTYDSERRATSSSHAGGIEKKTVTYNADGTTTVADSNNISSQYEYQLLHGVYKTKTLNGPGCKSCDLADAQYTYDVTTSDITSVTKSGLTTAYRDYDSNGNPGYMIEAFGTPKARRTDYTYDPRFFSKVQTKTEPSVFVTGNKVTTYSYDDFGNTTSISINGYQPDGTAISRTIALQYNGPLNQLSQIDGSRTDTNDITDLTYYPNEDAQGNNRSRIKSITIAEGILLRDNIQYSATGKVLTETRPNGLQIINTYYLGNDRLETTTETAGGISRVTRWSYLASGEVATITLADGSDDATTISLGYDDARRLTRITDGLGNYIAYTLDTEGNQTNESIYDANNVLQKTLSQTFDAYNRLDVSTQINEINDYSFNPDGTLDTLIDGNSKTSQYTYDELKRLSSITQDQSGTNPDTNKVLSQYGYDIADRLTTVTDPINGTTTYVYDDLGNLLTETSPDTGTKTYRHDKAGNIITLTDAKEQSFTYSYDALNRLTRIDAPGSDDDTTYEYDTCDNSIGQLCRITNLQTVTDYTYTGFGDISQHQGIVYSHDLAGRIKTITYPSDAIVTYRRDRAGQISQVTLDHNGQQTTLADNINYIPFGPIKTMAYGNTKTLNQSVDQAYRANQQNTLGVLALDYTQYDGNGNLQTRVDTQSNNTSNYIYDELNRLAGATGEFGNHTYRYDRNGNRTARIINGQEDNISYQTGSSRIQNLYGVTVPYDENGNILTLHNLDLKHNTYNRLIDINNGATTYHYNGLGQRSSKTTAQPVTSQPGQAGDANNDNVINIADQQPILDQILGISTAPGNPDCNQDKQINILDMVCLNNVINKASANNPVITYRYSLRGQLLSEQDKTNATINEYIYLNGQPLAVINQGQLYYVHNDHLGTPQKLTNTAGSVVWSGDYDPYGKATLNEDVDGDGNLIVFNIRFPGQYYDAETGLHYNYFRYYDPSTGRYITSDPIGLNGGLNTYGYVGGNPVNEFDSLGLADSITTRIIALAARGDLKSLNSLLQSGVLNPVQRQLAKQAVSKLNKINHIFGKSQHKLDGLVKSCKGKEDALSKLNDALTKATKGAGDGLVEITVNINGFPVTIKGNIVNGISKIGTAYIK